MTTIIAPIDVEVAAVTIPYKWGYDDALNGDDMQGSLYFAGCSLCQYNEGYAAGLAKRKGNAIAAELAEIAFFKQALVSLRSGQVKPFAVQSDVDPLAAEEWIGNAFSTAPYNW